MLRQRGPTCGGRRRVETEGQGPSYPDTHNRVKHRPLAFFTCSIAFRFNDALIAANSGGSTTDWEVIGNLDRTEPPARTIAEMRLGSRYDMHASARVDRGLGPRTAVCLWGSLATRANQGHTHDGNQTIQ